MTRKKEKKDLFPSLKVIGKTKPEDFKFTEREAYLLKRLADWQKRSETSNRGRAKLAA